MVEIVKVTEWTPQRAELIQRIRVACRDVDAQDPLDEAAQLLLKNHGLRNARLWVAETGFALLHAGALDLAVAPNGREAGTGGALLAACAAEVHSAWSHGDHPAAQRLAARHGLHATRELWVMRRPATALDPLSDPDEFTVRSYLDTDRDELLRVNAAAFSTHPEQGTLDAAGLAERMAEDWFDPAGLLVAHDPAHPDRLLGFHWTKRTGDLGEVYVVGVDPAGQGRGLGRVLTRAGLDHLHAHGVREVELYVEGDNLPALGLYAGLGFTHASQDTHVQYTRSTPAN